MESTTATRIFLELSYNPNDLSLNHGNDTLFEPSVLWFWGPFLCGKCSQNKMIINRP